MTKLAQKQPRYNASRAPLVPEGESRAYLLLTTYYLLPTNYYLLLSAYYLLPTTLCLLLTTYYLLLAPEGESRAYWQPDHVVRDNDDHHAVPLPPTALKCAAARDHPGVAHNVDHQDGQQLAQFRDDSGVRSEDECDAVP